MSLTRIPNGKNGRDTRGRFVEGNPGGPGNPYARQVARLRSLIREAVSEDDLRAIVATLVDKAKKGNLPAIREVFNRLIGTPSIVRDAEAPEPEQGFDAAIVYQQLNRIRLEEEAEERAGRCQSPMSAPATV